MKYIFLIGVLLILSCKHSTKKGEIPENQDWENLEAKLDSLFTKHFNLSEPGVAVLVSYNGNKIYAKGYGVRDMETKEPLTASSNMELASVSKQFTALAILSLVDENKLSLSDTIFKFLPYETFQNVTVQQLIDHTSGLDDAEEYLYGKWDSDKIASNNDILNWYKKENKKIENTDKRFMYNNGAYELLPLIVEKVSGKEYSHFIKEKIFDKASMHRTVAYNLNNPVHLNERAFYYRKDSIGNWKKMDGHPLTGIYGAGGIYSNLNDYFNYDNALANKTVFKQDVHNIIFKPTSTEIENGVRHNYAMGWYVSDSLAEHSGGWDGVNTFTRRYLNERLTLAFFANRDDFLNKKLISVTDSIVKSEIKKTTANNVYN
jgi:CubicO group peptidase (beta-lactamase class C family)